MSDKPLDVIAYIDGGSRGNPGPAAAGVVIQDARGKRLYEGGFFLGEATNNVAEYRGLLAALKAAAKLKAATVTVMSDSELLVRQMNGQYRVRNDRLRPLFEDAQDLADQFESFIIRHVPREKNVQADALVNRAMDLRKNVGNAASR